MPNVDKVRGSTVGGHITFAYQGPARPSLKVTLWLTNGSNQYIAVGAVPVTLADSPTQQPSVDVEMAVGSDWPTGIYTATLQFWDDAIAGDATAKTLAWFPTNATMTVTGGGISNPGIGIRAFLGI